MWFGALYIITHMDRCMDTKFNHTHSSPSFPIPKYCPTLVQVWSKMTKKMGYIPPCASPFLDYKITSIFCAPKWSPNSGVGPICSKLRFSTLDVINWQIQSPALQSVLPIIAMGGKIINAGGLWTKITKIL